MKVAFFADLLYYRLAAGSVRYAGELARHLAALDTVDLRLFSLYPREVIEQAALERGYPPAQSIGSAVPRPLQYLLWNTVGWPGAARGIMQEADVVHTPVLLVPPRRSVPLVVTVLDLSFILFPEYHGRWWRTMARRGLRRAVREADALIAISEHTADDLIRLTGVRRERVHVIPLAADPRFAPVNNPAVPVRYGIEGPYVLYVGALEPRKNLGVLLHAFAQMGNTDVKLVLAGPRGWMFDEIFDTVQRLGLSSRVVFPGFVPDEDLPALLSGAEAFVYPSRYEGFGLPVLEAMSCGVPVITTNASSLPEVAGDAAVTVAPNDAAGLSNALRNVLGNAALRDELRGKGLVRASRFSWTDTAVETTHVYQSLLARN